MPSWEDASGLVAESLALLADARQDPEEATERGYAGGIAPHQVVMTSMGNRRKALITPYFPGIEFSYKLPTRIRRAQAVGRPFVEAALNFSDDPTRPLYVATVCLRLGRFNEPDETAVVEETNWKYNLTLESVQGETTWDVVDAISAAAGHALPVKNRSGKVSITPQRLDAGNWALSERGDPALVVGSIHYAITNEIRFTRF